MSALAFKIVVAASNQLAGFTREDMETVMDAIQPDTVQKGVQGFAELLAHAQAVDAGHPRVERPIDPNAN